MTSTRDLSHIRSFFEHFGRMHRVAVALALLAATTVIGTLGYIAISNMAPLDALFMTVITLSTVGYREVQPLSPAGRIFTMFLIAMGIGITFYTLAAITEFIIEGRLRDILGRRTMHQRIAKMKDHIILCGYGRFGRVVAEELERGQREFVIVDNNPEKETQIIETGHPYVIGSALVDSVLSEAGVERAKAIVLAMESDADNVFAALSSREANPEISIHARGETESGIRRMRLAGATQVVSPYHIGGQRIANAILRPSVVDFLNLTAAGKGVEIDLEEIFLREGSPLHGHSLRELPEREVRVSVVAIKRGENPIQLNPGPDHRIYAGDHVVVVGDRENLHRLESLAAHGRD